MSAEVEARGPRGARHGEHHRAYGSSKPYVGQWWIWFVAVPALGTLGWWFGWDAPVLVLIGRHPDWPVLAGGIRFALSPRDESAARFMVAMVLVAGFVLAALSILIGIGHTGRKPKGPTERTGTALVVLHAAVSWAWGAALVDLIIIFGWSLIMTITIGTGAAIGAFGWNMYRADPFRADARGEGEKPDDTFDKLLGIKGAKVKEPEITGHHVIAEIEPPRGGHPDDIAKVLDRIEYAIPAALQNRARLDVDTITGRIKAVFTHTDPLEPWPKWTGPTAPGRSFELGCHSGWYEDGEPVTIKLAKHRGPDGTDVMPQHIGSAGTTRSGKSGHAVACWTDLAFTRNDVLFLYIDGAKAGQSMAGRLVDDVAALAATVGVGKRLLQVLAEKIVPWRAEVLGTAGFRDWSHEAYRVTGLPALFVGMDEAQFLCGLRAFTDLVTTCLSVGIFVWPIMPRVDGESMDTTAREVVNAWNVFGTGGDDHSHTFVMDDDTIKRGGIKVTKWGSRKPGYHFLVGANWVDQERYSLTARSLHASFEQAFEHIKAGREHRTTWHPGEIEILKSERVWDMIQPRRTSAATWSPVPGPDWAPPAARTDRTPPAPAGTGGRPEGAKQMIVDEMSDTVLDPGVEPQDMKDWRREDPDVIPPLPAPDDIEPGDIERFGRYTHRELEVPDGPDDDGPELEWGTEKEDVPTHEIGREEFERVIRTMAAEGITEFEPGQAIARFRYKRSPGWFTQQLDRLAEGEIVYPVHRRDGSRYGVTLQRLGYKKLMFVEVPEGTVAAAVVDPDPVVPDRGRTR